MKNVFAKYSTALIRIKLIEFAFCAVLATVLILTFPGVFYADVGLAKAALGGLIFSTLRGFQAPQFLQRSLQGPSPSSHVGPQISDRLDS